MRHTSRTSRGNNRNRQGRRNLSSQFIGKACLGTVVIHRSEQYLPCTSIGYLLCPRLSPKQSRFSSSVRMDKINPIHITGIYCNHNTLRTKFSSHLIDDTGVFHRCGIDGNLICTRSQEHLYVFHSGNTSPYGKRNIDGLGHLSHEFGEGLSLIHCCRDIQKDKFVSPFVRVDFCQLYRIAGISKLDKIDSLDRTAVFDVEAGNDSLC